MDVDPWEIGKNYPAQVAIAGDPKATLPDLAELPARVHRATPTVTVPGQMPPVGHIPGWDDRGPPAHSGLPGAGAVAVGVAGRRSRAIHHLA